MELINRTLAKIRPLKEDVMKKVESRLADPAYPFNPKMLGQLEDMALKYAGITGLEYPPPPRKCTVLTAADHGVAKLGISAYPVETTIQMTRSYLLAKGGNANAMANFCQSRLVVVDMGIAGDVSDLPGLLDKKIAYGTQDFTQGPAMSRPQAILAIETGISLTEELAKEGYQCFSLGEMGIGNTTSSAAIIAAFSGLSPEEVTGRGTGISDSRLELKIQVVKKGLEANRPDKTDGIDVLAKVGGFEIGALAGVILGAAANRSLVVIDGFNAGAAALIAVALSPLSKKYIMASHLSAEPGHIKTLEILELKPYIDLGLRLGEASGSSIGMNILDIALKAVNNREVFTAVL